MKQKFINIKNLSELSKINLNKKKCQKYSKEYLKIIKSFDLIQKINIYGIKSFSYSLYNYQKLNNQKLLLMNNDISFDYKKKQYFNVPNFID